MALRHFALEHLYTHHDHDIVIDAVPAVIAWLLRGRLRQKPPFVFEVAHETVASSAAAAESIALTWNVPALRVHDPTVAERVRRLQHGRTVQREHVTQLASYGLALVAVAVLMPGTRRALHAVRVFIRELLARRKPDLDILYQAGLGELTFAAQHEYGGDLVALIRDKAASRFAA